MAEVEIFQNQASKLKRYETKLKDIIAAYKTLQAENACLQEALQKTSGQTSVANADDNSKTDPQSTEKLKKALEEVNEKCEDAEHVTSTLRQELLYKTTELKDQKRKYTELRERTAEMEAVIENYRNELDASRQKLEKSAEFHEILNERVARLSRDLAVERRAVVDLQSSLSEAQQQHELSTNHFEMRLSELTANLKTYEETHKLDQQTIMRLRSPQNVEGEPKDISPLAAISSPASDSDVISDRPSRLLHVAPNQPSSPSFDNFLDALVGAWHDFISDYSHLVPPDAESQLLARLGIDCSSVAHDACERECDALVRQLTETNSRLLSLQDSMRMRSPSQHSKQVMQSLDPSKSLNDDVCGSTEYAEQIKLLRSQNVSLLSELEATKSSIRSRLAAASENAKLKHTETVTRYEGHIAKLETEARRYREQTLDLLAEKEDEISRLRTALFLATKGEAPQMVGSAPFLSPSLNHILSEEDNARGDSKPLPDSTQNGDQVSHCGLVHCAEQYGRLWSSPKTITTCLLKNFSVLLCPTMIST
uniref:Uncharacterized protein n=1 Tax=Schistocephalus solidus TaxID=70667 RepID=A0A0X3PGI6_SCHSO